MFEKVALSCPVEMRSYGELFRFSPAEISGLRFVSWTACPDCPFLRLRSCWCGWAWPKRKKQGDSWTEVAHAMAGACLSCSVRCCQPP